MRISPEPTRSIPVLDQLEIDAPHINWWLLLREAWLTVAAQPTRTLLTSAATALGIGILVLTLGLSATTEQQIAADFDALRATQVLAHPVAAEPPTPDRTILEQLAGLNGVEAAGVIATGQPVTITTATQNGSAAVAADLVAATPGVFAAVEATPSTGGIFSGYHQETAAPVVVVGDRVARELGSVTVDGYASILIDGVPHVVAGVLSPSERMPTLSHAVLVPLNEDQPPAGSLTVVVRTAPGAAEVIAEQTPYVLAPEAPETWRASAPPDPDSLRRKIEGGLSQALFAVATAVLIVALLSIASSTYVSVLERRRQIGVRRALGATATHIRVQVLAEAALMGAIGGIAGTTLATIALVAISANQQWTPAMPAGVVPIAPVMGSMIGLLSGALPAHRASAISPVEAMRND